MIVGVERIGCLEDFVGVAYAIAVGVGNVYAGADEEFMPVRQPVGVGVLGEEGLAESEGEDEFQLTEGGGGGVGGAGPPRGRERRL